MIGEFITVFHLSARSFNGGTRKRILQSFARGSMLFCCTNYSKPHRIFGANALQWEQGAVTGEREFARMDE